MAIDNIMWINTSSIAVLTATGSLLGTASYSSVAASVLGSITSATQAQFATSSLFASSSAFASSSTYTSQSAFATQSLFATSSITASYYKITPAIKSGKVASQSFSGTPLTASVTFTGSYPDTNYAVSILGGDARAWTVEFVSASNFTISTNSTQALTSYVLWTSIYNGESA
jgi:hypothetical protein